MNYREAMQAAKAMEIATNASPSKPRGASKARLARDAQRLGIAACGCVNPDGMGHTSKCSIYVRALSNMEKR